MSDGQDPRHAAFNPPTRLAIVYARIAQLERELAAATRRAEEAEGAVKVLTAAAVHLRGRLWSMRDNWAESSKDKQNELWRDVHDANADMDAAIAATVRKDDGVYIIGPDGTGSGNGTGRCVFDATVQKEGTCNNPRCSCREDTRTEIEKFKGGTNEQ